MGYVEARDVWPFSLVCDYGFQLRDVLVRLRNEDELTAIDVPFAEPFHY